MKSKIKISIIEDSEIHREWLRMELLSDPSIEIVSSDYFGKKGVESIRLLNPDVVLLDFQLEDMTGLEVAKRIKSHNNEIKILVWTAHTEISILERIITEKNIDAIAIKGSPYLEENLLNAIKQVIQGGTYIDPSLLRKLREFNVKNTLNELTKREFEIFIQANMGKPDNKIAEDLCVEVSHVKNIKSKIAKKINKQEIESLLTKLVANSDPDTLSSM